jgi:hypothetical protein
VLTVSRPTQATPPLTTSPAVPASAGPESIASAPTPKTTQLPLAPPQPSALGPKLLTPIARPPASPRRDAGAPAPLAGPKPFESL